MNKEELQELLDRVNMRINYNNKINNRLVSAYRKTKFGIKYDVTSKYLRNLQKTEKFLNTLIKKKDVSAKVRTSNKCDIWKGLVEMIGAGYTKIIRNCSKKGLTS